MFPRQKLLKPEPGVLLSALDRAETGPVPSQYGCEMFPLAKLQVRALPPYQASSDPATGTITNPGQSWDRALPARRATDHLARGCARRRPHACYLRVAGVRPAREPNGRPHSRTRAAGPVSDVNLRNRVWYPAIEAAGVRRFPPRIMRHTAASWLVQDGVPLYDVQALLGHESFATTQRYAHLAPDAHSKVIESRNRRGNAPGTHGARKDLAR